MHRNRTRTHGVLAAGLAGLVAIGSLAACSRPTAEATLPAFAPGPFDTYEPPPQPGDEGYPPMYAPTNVPEGYPEPGEEITDTLSGELPTEAITATVTATP